MKNVLLIAIVGFTASVAFAQSRQLTADKYYAIRDAADLKVMKLNYRHVEITRTFQRGRLISTDEWRYEYVRPDRVRYLHIHTKGKATTRTEEIDIGTSIYCKQGSGSWESVTERCNGGSGVGAGYDNSKNSFSVSDVVVKGRRLKRYEYYFTSLVPDSDNPGKKMTIFADNVFWLGSDGLVDREESRSGRLDPKTIEQESVDTYEYRPKDLKIEAPTRISSNSDE